tara:strand:+ start:119 stop:406 length:288 start_codon:yes stop_codon:yes gene_type:complete
MSPLLFLVLSVDRIHKTGEASTALFDFPGVAPAFFIGGGTSAYARVLAWLPPLYVQPGWSATATGRLLAGLTLCPGRSACQASTQMARRPCTVMF